MLCPGMGLAQRLAALEALAASLHAVFGVRGIARLMADYAAQ